MTTDRATSNACRLRFILYSILIGVSYCNLAPLDPDLGWHLLGGAWINEHHQVPFKDFINSFNPYWHDYHWLAQLAFYKIYQLGGYQALSIFCAILVGYLAKVIADIVLISPWSRRSEPFAFVLFVGATYLLHTFIQMRPQLISFVVIALCVRRLIQPAKSWEIPYLFAVTVLLANIHVYWIFIPFLWLMLRCLPRLFGHRTISAWYAWSGFFILGSAGFISPYGISVDNWKLPDVLMNYALIYEYMNIPSVLRRCVGEFKSTLVASSSGFWAILILIILISRTFRIRRALAKIGPVTLALIALALAIKSVKYLPVFAICALPYIAFTIGPRFSSWAKYSQEKLRLSVAQKKTAAWASIVLFLIVRYPLLNFDPTEAFWLYPTKTCEQLAKLKPAKLSSRDHLRVLTHFDHGGWCRWTVYQTDPSLDYRVTTDNRTQGVPEEHFRRSFDLFNLRNDWAQTLTDWDPDVAVVNINYPLATFMLLAPSQWHLDFQDERFALFTKVRPSTGNQ